MIQEVNAWDLRDGDIIVGKRGRKAKVIEAVKNLSVDIHEALELEFRYMDEKFSRNCKIHAFTKIKKEVPACGQ